VANLIDPTVSKLKVHNTLTRSVEEFVPVRPGRINMFVCGPTVWDSSHVGHAKTYVAYDIMARYLRRKGYSIFFILNITDIDDKIINRAKSEGKDPLKLADKYAQDFYRDMKDLGIETVNLYAKASDHIPEIIGQVQGLIDKGVGYRVEGDVYFDISKFPSYGKLSKLRLDELTVHRVDPDPRKRNPGDFVLWKSQKPGEISWESPWGRGRPGWHIEDTAITLTYFGPTYDLHGGGNELIFPHHEAEVAQAEALTGKSPLAKYWLHTGLLNISGREMHKSLGNIIPIQEALRTNGKDALRVLYASTHYRSPLEFTPDALEQAGSLAKRFRRAYDQLTLSIQKAPQNAKVESMPRVLEEARDEFFKSMDDDFNTPAALTAFIKVVTLAEDELKQPEQPRAKAILGLLSELGSILGVLEPESGSSERISQLASLLLELRVELRAKRDYETADRIRDRMVKMGFVVEDAAQEQLKVRPSA
jgi:cysteinyl-tRNA synthetase